MSSNAINRDLITLGEAMWRLSPDSPQRLEAAHLLNIHIGGAESNVAAALARLGKRTAWWSRLPDNPLGRHVASSLRSHGIDLSGVKWSPGRLGTYFVEFAPPPRPTQVIYDRADSAASHMQPDDFPWEQFQHARWLHLTGITPALSASCLATVRRAITEARAANTSISLDLNYRAKLWSVEQAAPILDELAGLSSLVIAAERDIRTLFDLEGEGLLERLHRRWNKATIVLTRAAHGSAAFDGSVGYHADAFPVPDPIRIGGGDAFAAGLLYALLEGQPLSQALRCANALAALKLTMLGDIAYVTRHELDAFLANQASAPLLR